MKKIITLFVIGSALFAMSCERHPYADFTTSHSVAYVGESVYFTNYSSDADFFEWNFGDGTFSNAVDAVHAFTAPGVYTVSLAAFYGSSQADRAYMDIEVIYPPTTLEVEVLEYYDEYPVPDAEVILYPTLADWEDMTWEVASGFTNRNGIVVFTDLDPKSYYLDVWEIDHNNYILAEDDIDFIRTLPLEPYEHNHFIAYVDYIPEAAATKAEAKKQSKAQLKIMKVERKHSDKVKNKK